MPCGNACARCRQQRALQPAAAGGSNSGLGLAFHDVGGDGRGYMETVCLSAGSAHAFPRAGCPRRRAGCICYKLVRNKR